MFLTYYLISFVLLPYSAVGGSAFILKGVDIGLTGALEGFAWATRRHLLDCCFLLPSVKGRFVRTRRARSQSSPGTTRLLPASESRHRFVIRTESSLFDRSNTPVISASAEEESGGVCMDWGSREIVSMFSHSDEHKKILGLILKAGSATDSAVLSQVVVVYFGKSESARR